MPDNANPPSPHAAPPFGPKDVEILNRQVAFDGFFRLTRYQVKHRLYAGGWSAALQREVLERAPCIALLPYDPLRDRVVMIEQFRLPAHLAARPAWQLEIIAGIIEADATAEASVHKEAQEEAGLEVKTLERICRYMPSAGGCTENIDLFIGGVDSRGATGLFGRSDEGEDIRAITLETDEAVALIDQGRIQQSAALIALLWLKSARSRLRESWLDPHQRSRY
jgi:ADP-ribose pyrophosphatase|tara:strand:+ start:8139 stop:8807 length:669 start_codon:yes stop_codon:yes gene_type:complete